MKEMYHAGNVILRLSGTTEWQVVVMGIKSKDSDNPGELYTRNRYYYHDLDHAAMRFAECVAGDEAQCLSEYVEAFKRAATRLHAALAERMEVSA